MGGAHVVWIFTGRFSVTLGLLLQNELLSWRVIVVPNSHRVSWFVISILNIDVVVGFSISNTSVGVQVPLLVQSVFLITQYHLGVSLFGLGEVQNAPVEATKLKNTPPPPLFFLPCVVVDDVEQPSDPSTDEFEQLGPLAGVVLDFDLHGVVGVEYQT